jgi:hypothetical protein
LPDGLAHLLAADSSQPPIAQPFGSSTPADISIAGQYTQCWRTMSLPIRW